MTTPTHTDSIAVSKKASSLCLYYKEAYALYAYQLKETLSCEIRPLLANMETPALCLRLDELGLSLTQGSLSMRGDYAPLIRRLSPAALKNELLVRAAKPKDYPNGPVVLDATAGMGEDSLLLAASGCQVILYEYNPIIAALLYDTLMRAAKLPELSEIVSRMQVISGDSIKAMHKNLHQADIIYLDPMFPTRSKSALIKKKFQLLQQLEQPCANEAEMLTAAIAAKPHKIIIKRPLKAAPLANLTPSYSLSGKAIRYDCLINVEQFLNRNHS